jgi:hypothetical protein
LSYATKVIDNFLMTLDHADDPMGRWWADQEEKGRVKMKRFDMEDNRVTTWLLVLGYLFGGGWLVAAGLVKTWELIRPHVFICWRP